MSDPIRRALDEAFDAGLPDEEVLPFVLRNVPECGKWPLEEMIARCQVIVEDIEAGR